MSEWINEKLDGKSFFNRDSMHVYIHHLHHDTASEIIVAAKPQMTDFLMMMIN